MAQVSIYFGSQSGTAECFAEEIHEEASQHGISTEVIDLRAFSPEAFASRKIVVFVVSTYGDGEPTDNAVDFHRWACNPNNDGALKGQRFCVMGLGDMNYTRFNQMGAMTDANLERLGGKRFYERGIGDDSQDIAEDFKKWKEGKFWTCLKQAVVDVEAEGGFIEMAKVTEAASEKLPLYLYVGHEENNGSAKDLVDCLTDKFQAVDLSCCKRQCLSDRKACEVVRKMPRHGVALVVVDCGPDGLCAAGKKLVRNMNVELDKEGLKDKGVMVSILTVATSKCNDSAAIFKNQIKQNCSVVEKAFDRVGATCLNGQVPSYVDVGVEDAEPVLEQVCKSIFKICSQPPNKPSDNRKEKIEKFSPSKAEEKTFLSPVCARTIILCTGNDAREAGEAIAKAFGNKCSVEDAALVSLAGAAREQTQVVLAIECGERGLTDGARGFASQLNSAPLALQSQLRKLRLALLTVVVTDVGNAGERANANAARAEIARAVEPLSTKLAKIGATCVASACVDLQDADEDSMLEICKSIRCGFDPSPAVEAAPTPAPPPQAVQTSSDSGLTEVRLAASIGSLPPETQGAPADVLARFYFEADKAKVLKVRELRQAPLAEEGLSTVEVEIDAVNNLKDYSVGGTLSLLPESDPADIQAMLPFFDLKPADLAKYLTFVVGAGDKLKQPFPTPCTLNEALSRYCDLARAPSKRMLVALQSKLKDLEAKERLGKLLKDEEALKLLQSSEYCCRMHEFWNILGVTRLCLGDFLLNCPRQKAREFTIASSPKASPGKISLCVSLSSHEQPDLASIFDTLHKKGITASAFEASPRGRFFGMCSSWLTSRLKVGDIVLAKQRPSPLKLPEKDVPIVMVGAGAGVAPFRGFWEELRKSSQTAPAVLFFGCRHPDKDWLYKEDMNGAVRLAGRCGALARMQVGPKRPLASLFPAFSRPDNAEEKRYVQDMVRHQAPMLKMAMESDGHVFICGSTAMGSAVLDALADALDNGKEAVEDLRKQGRIVAEMWG